MTRHLLLWLAVSALTAACTSDDFFTEEGRLSYRSDVCGQYLSPESTTPNLAGRGRSCVQNEIDEEDDDD